jgi:glycosyltransferase involved in cell wall biosynthesis
MDGNYLAGKSLSFIVPVKDEEATLKALFLGIADQCHFCPSWEVIFVDDGSIDASWSVIQEIANENPANVRALRFRRNLGKADALAAGWRQAAGDYVFTLDADLQDDPKEIGRFLQKMSEGFDIVTGWKQTRHDPWHKVLPSRVFNCMLSRVNKVKLHDHNCGFKCYRSVVIETIAMYGEMHRMVPSLALMEGFRTAEIPVTHHPRLHGRSKYGCKRFLSGFLDMWTVFFLQNYRQRPMHFFGGTSLIIFLLSILLAVAFIFVPFPTRVALLIGLAAPALGTGSILMFMAGLVAESQVHEQTRNERVFPIRETIDPRACETDIEEEPTSLTEWNENEPGILLSGRSGTHHIFGRRYSRISR